MRAVVVVAFSVACAACGLLKGGDEEAPPPRETTAAGDGGSSSSGSAATADGGASGSGFCASLVPQPTFCDDFERSEVLGPWATILTTNGGTVEIVRGARGRELRAAFSADGTAGGQAQLEKPLGHAAERVDVDYRLRIDAPPAGTGTVDVMHLDVAPDGGGPTMSVFIRAQAADPVTAVMEFATNGSGTTFHVTRTLSIGPWHEVHVTLDLGAPPHLLFLVDGTAKEVDATALSGFAPGNVTLSAGFGGAASCPCGPFEIHADEIVATVK